MAKEMRAIRLADGTITTGGREATETGGILWVDCTPTPDNLAWLAERFGFHPLALEDCAHEGQRPKFEEYPSALFAVIHRLAKAADDSGLTSCEINAFLTPDALVTVHQFALAEIDRVFDRCSSDQSQMERGTDFVLYQVWDAITDLHFAIADDLTEEIDDLAAEVMAEGAGGDGDLMARILQARRSHGQLRRQLAPQREVFAAMSRPGDPRVKARTAPYFRNLLDHILRITEEIDVGRDLLGSTMDIHLSMVNNRLSVVMTRLTLASTIFLPLTFLTGFFGMNLEIFAPTVSKVIVFTALALLPAAMLFWFKRSRWL